MHSSTMSLQVSFSSGLVAWLHRLEMARTVIGALWHAMGSAGSTRGQLQTIGTQSCTRLSG